MKNKDIPLEIQEFIARNGLHVPYIFKYGSRVYGTDDVYSDYDYIGITLTEFNEGQLKLSDKVDITLYGIDDFMNMIGDHHITALECIWQDNLIENRPNPFMLDMCPVILRESISKQISHCWVKGKKKLTVGSLPKVGSLRNVRSKSDDRHVGLKSIFHAFRICDFGIQIAQYGRIVNYGSANKYWQMLKNFDGTWEELDSEFKSKFNTLKSEFKAICPKN